MMAETQKSGHGWVTMDWADDVYSFRLGHGQVFELEEKLEIGIAEIYNRLASDRWRLRDVSETVRLALIGGGMDPAAAVKKVRAYVFERPYKENVEMAKLLIMACLNSPGHVDLTKVDDKSGEPTVATENAVRQSDLTIQ
jgi:Phage tail tube protein, GTA-gp10